MGTSNGAPEMVRRLFLQLFGIELVLRYASSQKKLHPPFRL